ncbi:hypothetical protein HCG51_09970 [Tolypothrix sp. PCC 7910]|uniref:hypothetical protein n=1 Tax=Tolypothrix sp. PCC 7910 TaxID=2099387 RepID=UPI0014279E74|nr:hypothetical protein [Tolypothrix sp. PCC 7910]QIR37031.1 hypothetical protein HCG51_09970 [Tolypothrix sp. PCC 7910]
MKIRQMLAVAAIPFVIGSFAFAPSQAKAEAPAHQHEKIAQQTDRPLIEQQKPNNKPQARHQKPRPQQKKPSPQRPQPHQNHKNTQTPQAHNLGLEEIQVKPNYR